MKTIKYIILGVILSSLVFSSFSFYPSKKNLTQEETVTFCETYTQEELISKLDPNGPFFTLVNMKGTVSESSRIGRCNKVDLKQLGEYTQSEVFRSKVQKDLIIVPGAEARDEMISLYALRKSSLNDAFPGSQDVDDVSVRLSDYNKSYELYISFSKSGEEKWATMTRLNKGRDIAILFKGKVLAAPRVQEEIKNGKCSISGDFTESEANALKTILEN